MAYFGESASSPNVGITEHHGHTETEDEKNDGVGVKAKVVVAIVYSTSIESLGCGYNEGQHCRIEYFSILNLDHSILNVP